MHTLELLRSRSLDSVSVGLLGLPANGGTDENFSEIAPDVLLPAMLRMLKSIGVGEICNHGILPRPAIDYSCYEKMLKTTADFASLGGMKALEILNQGQILMGLGGDHSVSLSTVKAFLLFCRKKGLKPGVLQVDQHGDYQKLLPEFSFRPQPFQGGRIHSMVSALHCGFGAPELTDILDPILQTAVLDPKDLLIVGTNALDAEEIDWLQEDKVEVKTIFDSSDEVCEAIIRLRKRVDLLFVTWDTDAMDLTVGCGTPMVNENGLSLREMLRIAKTASMLGEGLAPIGGMDFAEYSPAHDTADQKTLEVLKMIAAALLGSNWRAYDRHMHRIVVDQRIANC